MYIGSYGYDHYWYDSLSPNEQEKDVEGSLEFLDSVGAPIDNWIMCYPYGAYNDSLIEILKAKSCQAGLTTNIDIASVSQDNAFTLERLDTNEFPKIECTTPNEWTKKVIF